MALGMHRRGSAAMIPDAAFYHLENGIFVGPNVRERPGQQRITNQVTGPIEGMCDTSDIGAPDADIDSVPVPAGIYMLGNLGTDSVLSYYDGATTVNETLVTGGSWQGQVAVVSPWGTLVTTVFKTGGTPTREIWEISRNPGPASRAILFSEPTPGGSPVASVFTAPVFLGTDLFVGTSYTFSVNPSASFPPRVMRLVNGILVEDDVPPIVANPPETQTWANAVLNLFGVLGSVLYAAPDAVDTLPGLTGLNMIRRRSGGAWAPDPSSVTSFSGFSSGCVYLGRLYFGGRDLSLNGVIISTDGASNWTRERDLGATVAVVHYLASFNGFLYYAYLDSTPQVKLGRYSSATGWVDAHSTLGDTYNQVGGMGVSGGSLYLLCRKSAGGAIKLVKSTGTNTTAWTVASSPGFTAGSSSSVMAAV
jgi:hypothetical protein